MFAVRREEINSKRHRVRAVYTIFFEGIDAMTAYTNEMWEAAEFLTEWKSDKLTYKLLSVPRDAIDEGSEEHDASILIGIDSGGVRRVDILIDSAHGRTLTADQLDAIRTAAKSASYGYRQELCNDLNILQWNAQIFDAEKN